MYENEILQALFNLLEILQVVQKYLNQILHPMFYLAKTVIVHYFKSSTFICTYVYCIYIYIYTCEEKNHSIYPDFCCYLMFHNNNEPSLICKKKLAIIDVMNIRAFTVLISTI